MRDRVWNIIKETGYTPNQSARDLKQGKNKSPDAPSGTLACILGRTRTLDENPFFAQLARGIEQQAMERGYPVRHSYSVFDMNTNAVQENVAAMKTDGAIVLGRFSDKVITLLEHKYKNIVYVGRNSINAAWDQVICDGYEATQIALWHLISLGHRRIGYIGETAGEVRYQAYLDMVQKHQLHDDKLLISESPQSSAGGYQGAEAMLKACDRLPTAVFCAADVSAIAALRRFTEAKIKVPEQLSIISIDNIELSGYVSPMLTTVGMPIIEMGNVAVQTLICRIQKRHKLPLKIYLPNKLLRRESVLNLNEGMYI